MKSKEEIEQLAERYADGYSTEEAHASYIAFQDGYTQCQEDMELSDWDVTLTDGLEEVEWDNKQVQSPKDKAKEMYIKFDFVYVQNYTSKFEVKQCALIAVDEIIKQFVGVYKSFKDVGFLDATNVEDCANYKYWQEVKQEIDKL